VSGWDLIYDNGYIEIDPAHCGYTTFLGAAVPQADASTHSKEGKQSEESYKMRAGSAAGRVSEGQGALREEGENRGCVRGPGIGSSYGNRDQMGSKRER